MPNPAMIGMITAGSSMIGSGINAYFGYRASQKQTEAAEQGIEEVNNRYSDMQGLLNPYTSAGESALNSQRSLLGLNGAEDEAALIESIKNSPEFSSLLKQGENSILSNASATGGLRGGNTNAALAEFSPALLSNLINQRYSRLGGISSMGYGAASNLGAGGLQTGGIIADLLAGRGAAKAGGQLAIGQGISGLFGSSAKGAGAFLGAGGKFPSMSTPTPPTTV